jgi:hypothetical protein
MKLGHVLARSRIRSGQPKDKRPIDCHYIEIEQRSNDGAARWRQPLLRQA